MSHLHLDFETYSEADIKRCGAYHYAMHPSTEALMLAWAIDDGPIGIWDIAAEEDKPGVLFAALACESVQILAFNATFERLILKHCMGIDLPISRFRCVQVRSYGLAFVGGLDAVADQFNLGIEKDARGKALINRFSKPQPKSHKVRRWTAENDPEGWEEFKQYCIQDVEVERQLWKKCEPYHFPEEEWANYALSEKINDEGVPVDTALLKSALETAETEKARLKAAMMELMPGVANPNSRDQLIEWLRTQGCVMLDATKDAVAATLEKYPDEDSTIHKVLRLKQQLAKTSVTKWAAFARALCPDGRVHGMFQFGGASRTMRWAGRIVQLQNLARGGNATKDPSTAADILSAGGYKAVLPLYGNVMGLLSDTTRAAITAPPGDRMIVTDLSSIESRVLGWVADCKAINDAFANGLDTYRVFAVEMFGVGYDEVTKQQRNFSKPPVLGGGYMLGGKGLVGYAEGMGVIMSTEEADAAIKVWREKHPEVVDFWAWCKKAVFHTTLTGQEYPGPHGLKTFSHGEFLCIRLPSGRNLYYYQPKILKGRAPWGDMIDQFTYMGTDRHRNGAWRRISAHAGGITENIVQAIARDILCAWLRRVDAEGYQLFIHVHDELGLLYSEADAEETLEHVNSLIRQPINWAPGLLLDAAGYVAKRYRKD